MPMTDSVEIQAKLVHYGEGGEDLGEPVPLDARVVDDCEHGKVLEVVLPDPEISLGTKAIFIPVTEIRKLIAAKAI